MQANIHHGLDGPDWWLSVLGSLRASWAQCGKKGVSGLTTVLLELYVSANNEWYAPCLILYVHPQICYAPLLWATKHVMMSHVGKLI